MHKITASVGWVEVRNPESIRCITFNAGFRVSTQPTLNTFTVS